MAPDRSVIAALAAAPHSSTHWVPPTTVERRARWVVGCIAAIPRRPATADERAMIAGCVVPIVTPASAARKTRGPGVKRCNGLPMGSSAPTSRDRFCRTGCKPDIRARPRLHGLGGSGEDLVGSPSTIGRLASAAGLPWSLKASPIATANTASRHRKCLTSAWPARGRRRGRARDRVGVADDRQRYGHECASAPARRQHGIDRRRQTSRRWVATIAPSASSACCAPGSTMPG